MVAAGIDGTTRIMGVIGDPIAQIMTPTAINPLFAGMGANIVCVPVHVRAAELGAAWQGFKAIRSLIDHAATAGGSVSPTVRPMKCSVGTASKSARAE